MKNKITCQIENKQNLESWTTEFIGKTDKQGRVIGCEAYISISDIRERDESLQGYYSLYIPNGQEIIDSGKIFTAQVRETRNGEAYRQTYSDYFIDLDSARTFANNWIANRKNKYSKEN